MQLKGLVCFTLKGAVMTTIDPKKVQLAEKDIEDWLYEYPGSLDVTKWVGRQVHVPSGIIDLLGVDEDGNPVVVEVKNVEITADAVLQVCRYAADIERGVDALRDSHQQWGCSVRRVVIGKGAIANQTMYEANAVDVELHTFGVCLELDIDGPYSFDSYVVERDEKLLKNLVMTDEGFKSFLIPPEEPAGAEGSETASEELPEAFRDFVERAEGGNLGSEE